MPVIPSSTVRIDERADADTPEVAERIAIATDGVDHLVDPSTRGAVPAASPKRRRRSADAEPDTAA